MRTISNDSIVVAGSGADGHGVITGWRGKGGMTHAKLIELATRCGIAQVYMPVAQNAEVQLARAVRAVAGPRGARARGGSGYDARQEKRGNAQLVEDREPTTRWLLVEANATGASRAGDKFGNVVLIVSLFRTVEGGHELVFDCDDVALAERVRDEFDARIGAEQLVAADITRWLHDVHFGMLHGVRYGVGWYVPRRHRQIAEAIVEVFAGEGWGEDWMNPPVPCATSAQLANGITNGLIAEVGEVLEDLAAQRARVRENRKDATADIGARAAESFMIRLTRVGARMTSYRATIGEDNLADCQSSIHDAMIELDAVLEGGITSDWNGIWHGIEAAGKRAAA